MKVFLHVNVDVIGICKGSDVGIDIGIWFVEADVGRCIYKGRSEVRGKGRSIGTGKGKSEYGNSIGIGISRGVGIVYFRKKKLTFCQYIFWNIFIKEKEKLLAAVQVSK